MVLNEDVVKNGKQACCSVSFASVFDELDAVLDDDLDGVAVCPGGDNEPREVG